MSSASQIFINRDTPISSEEAQRYLNDAERGQFKTRITNQIPDFPKAGNVFLYRKRHTKNVNYRSDQYAWRCRGEYSKGTVRKTKFGVVVNGETMSNFTKDIFQYKFSNRDCPNFVLIHYLGDERVFDARQSNSSRRQAHATETESKSYDEEKSAAQDHDDGVTLGNRSQSDDPKEPRLHKAPRKHMMHREKLFSVLEMAQSDVKNFVLKYDYSPHGSILILGEKEVIKLSRNILEFSNRNAEAVSQLLCYDTRPTVSDAY